MSGGRKGVILAGDIGETNTRLAIIDIVKEHFDFLAEETFSSNEEPSLENSLRKFLSSPTHLVTGPVRKSPVLSALVAVSHQLAIGDRFAKDSTATQPPPGQSDQ